MMVSPSARRRSADAAAAEGRGLKDEDSEARRWPRPRVTATQALHGMRQTLRAARRRSTFERFAAGELGGGAFMELLVVSVPQRILVCADTEPPYLVNDPNHCPPSGGVCPHRTSDDPSPAIAPFCSYIGMEHTHAAVESNNDGEAATKAPSETPAAASAGDTTTEAPAVAAVDAQRASSAGEKGASEAGGSGDANSGDGTEKGVESTIDAAGLWMYLDGVNPTQHGPLTESVLLKLLRVGTAHKDMMAWSQGMSEWKPLGQVSLIVWLTFDAVLCAAW